MAGIEVATIEQAHAILREVHRRLRDWEGVWDRLEEELPAVQKEWWDRRFDRSLVHSKSTRRARAKGLRGGKGSSYYDRHRPGPRATATQPYFEWTGSLREATEKFTPKQKLRAQIDAKDAYQGPLRRQIVDWTLGRRRRPVKAWDKKLLTAATYEAVEEWIEDLVSKVKA